MEGTYKVYQRRIPIVLYLIGSIVILTVAAFYMHSPDSFSNVCIMQEIRGCCFDNPIFYYVLGKGLVTYFGLCIAVFILLLIRPYCLFYMNDGGFWTQDYGFVKWDNVAGLNIKNLACQTVICFDVKDKENFKVPLVTKLIRIFSKVGYYVELSRSYSEVNEVYKKMQAYV